MSKNTNPIKKIALLTSGGDAPGMNAAIRSITRMAIWQKIEVVGVVGGFEGLIDNNFKKLNAGSVANIIQRGGTLLKTARSDRFKKTEHREQAFNNLKNDSIDGLICIGGDGTFSGANIFSKEHNFPVIGVPGTIDNDINGTDYTIGFDTSVNTAVEAIDRIRDTAASHDRLFIVEVMGRNSGFIAAHVGLACGAEEVFTPDVTITVDDAVSFIKRGMQRGKGSSILITSEGQKPGRAYDLKEAIRKKSGFESKVCILGHIQRGGSPTATDRIMASRMGAAAINALVEGKSGYFVAYSGGKLNLVLLTESTSKNRPPELDMIKLAHILSA